MLIEPIKSKSQACTIKKIGYSGLEQPKHTFSSDKCNVKGGLGQVRLPDDGLSTGGAVTGVAGCAFRNRKCVRSPDECSKKNPGEKKQRLVINRWR